MDAPHPVPHAVAAPAAVSPPAPAQPAQSTGAELLRKVLRVAWLSIGLGMALEVLLLTVAAYAGTAGDSPKPFIADLVQKVSWSFLVCVGIAFGTVAAKARAGVMGLLGLISAPVAFTTAKSLHKAVSQAMGMVGGAAVAGPSPLLIAALKVVEYGVLGAALGWLGRSARGSLGAHVGLGALAGIVFGGTIVGVTVAAGAQADLVSLLGRGIDEVLFPVGCALVLYASEAIGQRIKE
jgi:hypothetical protein